MVPLVFFFWFLSELASDSAKYKKLFGSYHNEQVKKHYQIATLAVVAQLLESISLVLQLLNNCIIYCHVTTTTSKYNLNMQGINSTCDIYPLID